MRKTIPIALAEYGVTEHKGATYHNPRILQYFKETGHLWVVGDQTAWCSCFASWVAKKAGYNYSRKLTARSWLSIGQATYIPVVGDIVVFWREHLSSWKGHVGFYINHSRNRNYIYCLGGNQNNSVCIKAYPVKRLLGFRQIHIKSSQG
ncbi:TIGR02594 family protein [Aquimarina sp. TRL1]|uniref:TIGR02594 family protein n=1 Tax=Aquimarina sp. (strain TRL1) TaxID=2736252 RepID=UPI001589A8AC|nr:TIGR02594 family protein [Aquimarina sp. TRL1]QKX05369.1 TIGR02594 family protein [Aquimarina sp. TRL1]